MIRVLVAMLAFLTALPALAQSGAYAGVSVGRFQAKSTWTTTQLGDPAICPPTCLSSQDADLGTSAWQWAGHVGYDLALGRAAFVGVEGSVGNNSNARTTLDHVPGWTDDGMQADRITATYEWNMSVVARAGLVAGPVVLYGLAGPSWQKTSVRFECPGGTSWCNTPQNENRADVRFGWTGGGGAEVRLPHRWAARLEYRYAKYEDKEYSFFGNSGTDQVFAKVTLKTSVVSLGLSYRF
ncbi:MAG: outer rane immunogenic protein [Betaproteobacteria bacterium]|jgi:opacity protein-like surface antigen|nr:outer rane immunogenic protein [Betaproteobacteria bacterium]